MRLRQTYETADSLHLHDSAGITATSSQFSGSLTCMPTYTFSNSWSGTVFVMLNWNTCIWKVTTYFYVANGVHSEEARERDGQIVAEREDLATLIS